MSGPAAEKPPWPALIARRDVETFSPYARQFLERMDKPAAERIEGIPPAIAIDQTNPVRTSRAARHGGHIRVPNL